MASLPHTRLLTTRRLPSVQQQNAAVMSAASPSSLTTNSASSSTSSSALHDPPFAAYLTGKRLLIWDLQAAQLLRHQHRIIGECKQSVVQVTRRSGVEQLAHESDSSDTAAAYTSAPVHYSLPQAQWLLRHGRQPALTYCQSSLPPSVLSAANSHRAACDCLFPL